MKRIVFYMLLLIAFSASLFAEKLPYPTQMIKGVEHYQYKVEQSEGLYRISKKFGVSQEDIIKANPILKAEGLRLGQVILIPVAKEHLNSSSVSATRNQESYIIHEIKPKETLYGLSKHYGVTIEEIVALNPEESNRMTIGATLRVPQKKSSTQPTAPTPEGSVTRAASVSPAGIDSTLYIVHEVAPKENLYRISKLYDVSQNDIKALNPGVERRVPAGQRLLIARKPHPTQPTTTNGGVTNPTTPAGFDAASVHPAGSTPSGVAPIRIALLLPFMLDAPTNDPAVARFVEFYEGALLAINKAKSSKQAIEIYTYDIEKNDLKVRSVLSQPELKEMDLIIGPAYPVQVKSVSDFAMEHKVLTLIPFTSRVPEIDTNPYLIQFNMTAESERAYFLDYLLEQRTSYNVVWVDVLPNNSEMSSEILFLRNRLRGSKISYKQMSKNDLLNNNLNSQLDKNRKNLVIFNSETYSHVSACLPYLANSSNTHSLELFGYFGWMAQREQLPCPMIYTSLFYIQPGLNIHMANYRGQFERYFGHALSTENPRYDLIGYDMLTFFLEAFRIYSAEELTLQLGNFSGRGVQSSPQYVRKSPKGGWVNTSIYLLRSTKNKTERL